MKRICLWGAWYGSRNAGDQAVLWTIGKLLNERIDGVELVVFSDKPRQANANLALAGIRGRALHKWKQLPAVILSLASADLFIIGGGVPFYDKGDHLLVFTFLVALAKMAGCPVMAYAVASQSLRSPVSRWVYRHLLDQFRAVTVRDPLTQRQLSSLGSRRPITLTADPAFTLAGASSGRIDEILMSEGIHMDPARPLIGVTTRQLSSSHGYRGDHYRQLTPESIEAFQGAMARAADFLAMKGQVCFIPMNTECPDDDRVMAGAVLAKMRRASSVASIRGQYTPAELMGVISRCGFLLASRLHSTILAAAAGVPFAAVAYDPKLLGIAESLHMSRYAHDMIGLRPELLLETLQAAWEQRQAIRQLLLGRVAELKTLAYANADLAVQLASR